MMNRADLTRGQLNTLISLCFEERSWIPNKNPRKKLTGDEKDLVNFRLARLELAKGQYPLRPLRGNTVPSAYLNLVVDHCDLYITPLGNSVVNQCPAFKQALIGLAIGYVRPLSELIYLIPKEHLPGLLVHSFYQVRELAQERMKELEGG